jgi:hypothetical protein
METFLKFVRGFMGRRVVHEGGLRKEFGIFQEFGERQAGVGVMRAQIRGKQGWWEYVKGRRCMRENGETKTIVYVVMREVWISHTSESRGATERRLLDFLANATLLLTLKLVVEQEESLLIGLGSTNNSEHALASFVMRGLGDGDLGTRKTADFCDLRTGTADDATHHVGGNRDILGANVATNGVWSGRGGSRRGGDGGSDSRRWGSFAVGSGRSAVSTGTKYGRGGESSSSRGWALGLGTGGTSFSSRMVEDCANSALPIFEKATTNLFDGTADTFSSTLYLNDSFRRLGKHILGCNHTSARSILNGFDLHALTSDDGTHEIVGDEEAEGGVGWRDDGGSRGSARRLRLEQLSDNERISFGDAFDWATDGQDTLMDTRNDFGNAGLDTRALTKFCDIFTSFSDNDASLLCGD